jgi:hypothetical protein
MAGLERKGCAFAISFTLAMLTACGGSQPPIGAPNGMSQNATRQEPGSRAPCKGGLVLKGSVSLYNARKAGHADWLLGVENPAG